MDVRKSISESALPFGMMVLMEGCTIALTIMASSAMSEGMNQFVFVAYSNALSSVILLPYALIVKRNRIREMLNSNLLTRFFFLGLTGIAIAQNLAFTGLRYSSPIVVCGMGLLLPTFQFALALILRKAKLDFRSSSIQMRISGALVSIAGAATVAMYEGPSIIQIRRFHSGRLWKLELLFLNSSKSQWLFGSILLACATLSLAVWSTIQVATITRFPDMLLIVTSYTIFGTLQTAVVDLIAERDLSAWKLNMNLELAIIVLTAIFGTVIRSSVQAWCMSLKGPVYVSMFKPFGIFWACLISLSLFGSSLHYGSVLGTSVVAIGYCTVIWGSTKEDEERNRLRYERLDSSGVAAPLIEESDQSTAEDVNP